MTLRLPQALEWNGRVMAGSRAQQQRRVRVREARFIEGVCKGLKGAEAARYAGFSGARADVAAGKLMMRPHVRAAIDQRTNDALHEAGVTRTMIVREMASIAFSDPRRLFDENGNLVAIHELPQEMASAVASVEVDTESNTDDSGKTTMTKTSKVKLWDKRAALADLAKIARLVSEAPPAAPPMGPGMQVLVQQVIQQPDGNRVSVGQRVVVSLPRPEGA
jgi:phage terminase small subunit